MNPESTRVPESSIASLGSCLIEGDLDQLRRNSKIRRRAIFLSVVLQSITVAALLLFPLLGKGEHLSTNIFVPLPPYRLGSDHQVKHNTVHNRSRVITRFCYTCRSPLTTGKPTIQHPDPVDPVDDSPYIPGAPAGDPRGVQYGIDIQPRTPVPADTTTHSTIDRRHRIVLTHIDPARLTRRVEPVYPHLALQLRRETRVELHAIIATDGSVQSLQVISGDPLFYQSALDAVREWRYTPTFLNDQPVEVDTHMTVIYTLNH